MSRSGEFKLPCANKRGQSTNCKECSWGWGHLPLFGGACKAGNEGHRPKDLEHRHRDREEVVRVVRVRAGSGWGSAEAAQGQEKYPQGKKQRGKARVTFVNGGLLWES